MRAYGSLLPFHPDSHSYQSSLTISIFAYPIHLATSLKSYTLSSPSGSDSCSCSNVLSRYTVHPGLEMKLPDQRRGALVKFSLPQLLCARCQRCPDPCGATLQRAQSLRGCNSPHVDICSQLWDLNALAPPPSIGCCKHALSILRPAHACLNLGLMPAPMGSPAPDQASFLTPDGTPFLVPCSPSGTTPLDSAGCSAL